MCDHSGLASADKQCNYKHIIECWNASNSSCLMLSCSLGSFKYLDTYEAKFDHKEFIRGTLRGGESLPFVCLYRYSPDKKGTVKKMSESSEILHDWYSYLRFNKTTNRDLNTIWKAEATDLSVKKYGTRIRRAPDRFTC